MPRMLSGTGVRAAGLLLCALASGIDSTTVRADCLTPVLCPGDSNGDRTVDFTDVLTTLANFGGTGPEGDSDHNSTVNFADILSTLANFGLVCPALRIIEPGTFSAPPASPVTATAHVLPAIELDDFESRGIAGTGVYGFSGEFHHSEIDLIIPSRGLDMVLTRRYRSRIDPESALGPGWDFSWNVWVSPIGDDLLLHDGNGRQDIYRRGPIPRGDVGGALTWEADEFFRVFTQEPDGSLTLTFADRGRWRFFAIDGSPAQGRISASIDRNGNTITFEYDPLGRLVRVVDVLDSALSPRAVTLVYSPEGRLASVADWVGRSVVYQHYGPGEAGGSPGDLKSVTTPVVVPTPEFPVPPGHEYPAGKTTVYTYSTGFADEELNHNLLTITDPKGQTILGAAYGSGGSPGITDDTVLIQFFGGPADRIKYHYLAVSPDAANNFATLRVIRNDRVGNVEEWFYDSCNRAVMIREFTGRANPVLVTTDTANRPTGQVRATDPVFFETRYTWSEDALPTLVVFPNGNSIQNVYELHLNPLAGRRSRGNLREVHRVPGPLGGDRAQIVETFTYDPGSNFCQTHTDGRGNTTTYGYDPLGNRLQILHRVPTAVEDFQYNAFGQMTRHTLPPNGSGHRREDAFTFYTSADGPMHGYLRQQIVDATGLALTTTREYDAVGNPRRVLDPSGNDDLYIFNQLNQVVLHRSRPVMLGMPPTPIRYEIETFYDANNLPAHVSVLNVNEEGVVDPANPHLTTLHDFDVLNNVVRTCREKGSFNVPRNPPQLGCAGLPLSEFVTTELEYDANRDVALVRFGEAVSGADPDNVCAIFVDERCLILRVVSGPGSPEQSTDEWDYDGNGNVVRHRSGVESVPVRLRQGAFDGYDRLVSTTDPMGNVSEYTYDANGNTVGALHLGELEDVAGDVGNLRLREAAFAYDALDRLITRMDEHFDPATQAPIGDGQSVATIEWSDTSQIVCLTDDNGHTREYEYDSANRPSLATDAAGNTVGYAYDANSRVVSTTGTEERSAGPPAQQFVLEMDYDALDRLRSFSDNVGNLRTRGYDSRGNVVVAVDALGRVTRCAYDGIDRLELAVVDMNGNGANPADAADIVRSQAWDDSHRLIACTDDNGNQTTYIYDALNRQTGEQRADGTSSTWVYDANGNRISLTDANGSSEAASFDLLDRVTNRTITVAPGVSGETTFRAYAYDGLSRMVRARDDDSLVTRDWDSLSFLVTETQNGRGVLYLRNGIGNTISVTYPSGAVITRQYDSLDRVARIDEPPFFVASFGYAGPSRLERRDVFNGTSSELAYNGVVGAPNAPGDNGFKQVVGSTHLRGAAPIDVRTYAWDAQQSKTRRSDVRAGGPMLTHAYAYDAADRLAATVVTNPGGPVRNTQYILDGVGNRQQVINNGIPGAYLMNPASPIPADRQVNQYTQTPVEARAYDENGNTASATAGAVVRQFAFNYFDELVSFSDSGSGVSAVYRYDALGRRIGKTVTSAAGPDETQFVYACIDMCNDIDEDNYGSAFGVIEEWDGAGALRAGYICSHGRPLVVNRGGVIRVYHHDDMGSTMALTDHAGNLAEFIEYGDFGAPSFFNSIGIPTAGSLAENPVLFHGHYFDAESGLYYAGRRYLDPQTGRFVSRDPGGAWDDPASLGNALTYGASNPWSYIDPDGRAAMHSSDSRKPGGGPLPKKDPFADWFTPLPKPSTGSPPRVVDGGLSGFGFTKELDKATPKFAHSLCRGEHLKEVTIHLCRAESTGEVEKHYSLATPSLLSPLSREYCVQYRETDFSFVSRLVEEDGIYYSGISAIPPTISFRPPRIAPKPHVRGAQTAVVVGPHGEEIWPDAYGRVKVQFHWDRAGKKDENSSCWIRVAQLNTSGSIMMPRVGWEVIVDFEGGDPDRPLIVGNVDNSQQCSFGDTSPRPGRKKPTLPTLGPVLINPLAPGAGGGDPLPTEELSIDYAKIKFEYSPGKDGSKKGNVESEWKVEKGEK